MTFILNPFRGRSAASNCMHKRYTLFVQMFPYYYCVTPKKLTAFRLGLIDLRRLEKLAALKEWSRSAVVREALKRMAEEEGVR